MALTQSWVLVDRQSPWPCLEKLLATVDGLWLKRGVAAVCMSDCLAAAAAILLQL